MLDERQRNLQRYALHLEKKDLLLKGKKKKNDLKNILYFPSLFWFNGQFCPPIPYFTFDRDEGGIEVVETGNLGNTSPGEGKNSPFRVHVADFLTCGVHKNSVIVKRVVKNEVLSVSMFSDMKVVSCVFYVNIEYVLGLGPFFGTTTNPFFFCLSLATSGREGHQTGETRRETKRGAPQADNEAPHQVAKRRKCPDGGEKIGSSAPLRAESPFLICDMRNALDTVPRELLLYNEKKEIHFFDYVTNRSRLITRERIQVTAMQFSFLHISEHNSLYNKMGTDVYEGGIKIVDLDQVGQKLWRKNRYCFEVLQGWLSGARDGNNQPNEEEAGERGKVYQRAPCGQCRMDKILRRMFYVLIYGDSEGNIYFLIPEKEVKIKKNFRKGEKIHLIETNVKAYFNTKGDSRIATVLRNNVHIFLAYRDCILVFNFPLYQPLLLVNVADEVIFSLSACLNDHGEVYFAFSTQRCVRIGELSRGGELLRVEVDTTQGSGTQGSATQVDNTRGHPAEASTAHVDNTKGHPTQRGASQVQHSGNNPHNSKQQKTHTCVCFGRDNDLYITSGDKGIIHRYNLKQKQITHKYDPRCKRIFHLAMCTLNGEDYAYVYDAEKFLCLFQLTRQKNVYKIFTLSVWVYQILCFRSNVIFSLGNENVYNLEVKNEGDKGSGSTDRSNNRNMFLTKPFYSDRMSVCTYLINHPNLPLVAFVNKKLQFGVFSLVDAQRRSVLVPPIRENQNVFSLCWFSTRRQLEVVDFDGVGSDLTAADPLTLNQFTDEWRGGGVTPHCGEYLVPPLATNLEGITQNRGAKNKRKDDNTRINTHIAQLLQSSPYDTHLVVLNGETLFLYSVLTSQVTDLKDYLKKAMPQFCGKKNLLKSTIYRKVCYVFIFSEKNMFFIFDQYFTFSLRTINVDDRIVRFYLRDGYLFIHSNTSVYFTCLRNALSLFPEFVQGGDEQSQNLQFTKVDTAETFKIALFDFLCVGEETYLAVFTKRKEILVYRMRTGGVQNERVGMEDGTANETANRTANGTANDTPNGTPNSTSEEAHLVAQFLSFYQFEHLNKVGSILSMKFFYSSVKRRTYLIFGGLEQFLFFWDFAKYPLVRRGGGDIREVSGVREAA
ncbi:hypothetical protein C922_03504 [Plasmodium inui San Antonio 1]|uniref:Uncharacterized protein n=1 Tax=Plasmodium inui San Antonio 1 TaxID=1237626 RepID=W7AAC1_9APIC|nr:hypothetical protein C922_03504 [Plasmodium inui San Antonio 1]EUD66034.1 hypothetical protein C922_03504 [Plasmodium inui San Antonio 1]